MLLRYLTNLARYGRIDPIEYYVSHEFRLVYVENAKVACTAIKQALFPDVSYDEAGQDAFHGILRSRASFAPPQDTHNYTYFTVVREPCARFASAFRDKIVREGTDGIFGMRSQRLIFGMYAGIDPVAPTTDIAAFAKAVTTVPEKLRDRHIASQAAVVDAVLAAPNRRVIGIEDLADEWAILRNQSGIGELPKLNQTDASNASEIDPSARWVRDVVNAYGADFDALGYERPI